MQVKRREIMEMTVNRAKGNLRTWNTLSHRAYGERTIVKFLITRGRTEFKIHDPPSILSLPHPFPASLGKWHLSQLLSIILLNTTLFPDSALLIYFFLPTNQIRILRTHEFRLLDEFPT